MLALSLDPANVTLEAEYFPDTDRERYARRKPLLWFWKMFDRSPIGLNHWLGLRFRCMLGRHIFDHLGTGVKIYHGVDLTFGYNLSIGDGVTIRQGALLNDRGGITIGKGAVIGSFRADLIRTPTIRMTSRRSRWCRRSSGRAPASPATRLCWPGIMWRRAKRWARSRPAGCRAHPRRHANLSFPACGEFDC